MLNSICISLDDLLNGGYNTSPTVSINYQINWTAAFSERAMTDEEILTLYPLWLNLPHIAKALLHKQTVSQHIKTKYVSQVSDWAMESIFWASNFSQVDYDNAVNNTAEPMNVELGLLLTKNIFFDLQKHIRNGTVPSWTKWTALSAIVTDLSEDELVLCLSYYSDFLDAYCLNNQIPYNIVIDNTLVITLTPQIINALIDPPISFLIECDDRHLIAWCTYIVEHDCNCNDDFIDAFYDKLLEYTTVITTHWNITDDFATKWNKLVDWKTVFDDTYTGSNINLSDEMLVHRRLSVKT